MAVFSAKRTAPKPVAPLLHQGIRYETTFDGTELGFKQKAGVLIAYDAQTNEKLWGLVVYQTIINEKFERDVQDCHITSIALAEDGQSLIISNERRKRFALKLADQSVSELAD
ncbi:hypothetical protein V8J88_04485 [Massilia sp. W12]|uniref:hypothetical protein n=1 Tax=Massilia sp. W12 TaxID=3126507 RepID=UPI0030CB8C6B